MTEFAMASLVPSKKLRDNISIDVHLRKHDNAGEAKLAKHANRYRPRDFKVLLNHHLPLWTIQVWLLMLVLFQN